MKWAHCRIPAQSPFFCNWEGSWIVGIRKSHERNREVVLSSSLTSYDKWITILNNVYNTIAQIQTRYCRLTTRPRRLI